jgi:Ca-activated chloride channel family protein
LIVGGTSLTGQQQPPPTRPPDESGFKFRSGVELVNVTATVTDGTGRFVPGLRKEDFAIYEDGQLQTISNFSNERVPVSLGIVLDTSSSMAGEKFAAARSALDRFLYDLLDRADEIFVYRFSGDPELLQAWTTDRGLLSRSLSRIIPAGGTAMYDAVADAVPLAESGKHRKKALVVISDGNDTSSRTEVGAVKQLIRESEVMVYAIGIDGQARGNSTWTPPPQQQPRVPPPSPFPFPIPGRRRGGGGPSGVWPQPLPPPSNGRVGNASDRLNVAALRELTDDSGGRTEIIRSARDLDPATAGIADELSRQYYIGYQAPTTHDGKWHSIRVEVRNPSLRVRARRGYVAS